MRTKILLAVLIFFTVIGCRRKSSDNYEYYKPYTKDTLLAVTDTLAKLDSIDEETSKQELVEVKGVDLNDNYFIVIASYAVEEFAKSKKAELIEQGLKPEIFMINDDGWYKLAVKSYTTLAEAKAALEKLKSEKGGVYSSARVVFKKSKS